MNSITGSEEIILNDTFETQRTSPYNLLLASNNTNEKLSVIDGKETMSFNVDNVHRIATISDNYTFGEFNYSTEQPLPIPNDDFTFGEQLSSTVPIHKNSWNLYYLNNISGQPGWETRPLGIQLSSIYNLSSTNQDKAIKIIQKEYPNITEGIFINHGTNDGLTQLYFDINNYENENFLTRFQKTKAGCCSFTIAILPLLLTNDCESLKTSSAIFATVKLKDGITVPTAITDFANPPITKPVSDFTAEDYFKRFVYMGGRGSFQQNIISFTCNNPDNPGDGDFLIALNFRSFYDSITNTWEVRVYNDIGARDLSESYVNDLIYTFDGKEDRLRWDGLSPKKFKCYYEYINGELKCELYIVDDKNEIFISNNIQKSRETPSIFGKSPVIGVWTNSGRSCLVLSQFRQETDLKEIFFNFDGTTYNGTTSHFINKLKDEMTYTISGNGTITDNWDFLGVTQETAISETNTNIMLSSDKISEDMIKEFAKKDKRINISANTNIITAFENPNKKISAINLEQLNTLSSIDLSNNLIEFIDLSSNSSLKTINLSFNKNLKTVILPTTFTADTLDIDISNCAKLNRIIWPSNDLAGKTINININNTPKIKHIEISNTGDSTAYLKLITGNNASNLEKITLQNVSIDDFSDINLTNYKELKAINISESSLLLSKTNLELFLNLLPDRTGSVPGKIYLYGKKYTYNNIQGHTNAISGTLENLKNKNWLFYL